MSRLLDDLAQALRTAPDGPLGVAVSGGGDSTALLVLMQRWAKDRGRRIEAISIDHGLRAGSAAEVAQAAALAKALDIRHETRRWDGWSGQGNLQNAARRARRALIADWARARGLTAVATGHTQDDQAETLLMRLARGSGVDGLAAMHPAQRGEGILWLRPLLDIRRAALRAFLTAEGIPWSDDPSNSDPAFDRIALRQAQPTLDALGLTVARLAETARTMGRARVALEAQTETLARTVATVSPLGVVTLRRPAFAAAPEEVRLRLLAHALQWISAADYRPRLSALRDLDAITGDAAPDRRTLHGCLIENSADAVTLMREPGRTGGPVPAGALWDNRWLTGADKAGLTVRALGEAGLAALPDWRATGLPRAALLASPGFWQNDALHAAPFANRAQDCHVSLKDGPEGFFTSLRASLNSL